MKDRLLKIITSEGLSPALLADKIGVQRSGISHILSGRNYPSFDFLQKLLIHFPKLNAEWLIIGHGSMYKSNIVDVSETTFVEKSPVSLIIPEEPQNLSTAEGNRKTVSETNPESPPKRTAKSIERMMVLYTDKTFETYETE